jgi:ATP-binding cassette subfamily F protein uup
VVMVTHDRYMLESVANRIIEVQDGETIGYTGSYGDYLVERAVRRAGQQRSEDRRLSMIRREAAWASRSPAARTGKQKGRLNRLDTLRAARNLPQEREFEFGFETGIKSGNTLVEMYGLCKGFSDRTLIKDLDLTIRPGDRIGILGANGCGKSTLLNIIARKLEPDAGTISYGPRVQIGMLDQHRSGLKPDDTVLESAGNGGSHVKVGDDWSTIQGFLGRFLFDRTHFDQKVSKLSGGERARLLMAKLLLERNPLLLLDEPTNDLDLLTLRVLEEALLSYDGGAIIVTHDRAFLDRVCTAVLSNDGEGNWVMYASRMQQVSAAKRRLAAIKMEEKRVVSPPISVTSSQPSKRLSYQEKRDLEGLPAEIEALELEMTALTETMNDPATYRERAEQVPVLAKRLAEVEVAIETMFERWTELEERQGS